METDNISLLEGRRIAQAIDCLIDIFKEDAFPNKLVIDIFLIMRKMAMNGSMPRSTMQELLKTIDDVLEELTAPEKKAEEFHVPVPIEKPVQEQKPKEPAKIPQSHEINQPETTPITKPQKSADEIFPQTEVKETPTFIIGEFPNKQKEIKDISIFTPISNNLLRVLRDPNHENHDLLEETYDALLSFVNRNGVGTLILQEENLGHLTEEQLRGCILGRPPTGFALIKNRRVAGYEILIPWPDFSNKLLGKAISPSEGIEFDQISDIIYIAAPLFDTTQVIFYRIRKKR